MAIMPHKKEKIMNTLLNSIAAIVAPIMGTGICTFTEVNSTQVTGVYDGYRIVLSRVWDGNDHHVKLWWSARCKQNSFIHSELSQLLSAVLEKHQEMEEVAEAVRLEKMYAAHVPTTVLAVEVDDQDWFI